LQKKENAKIQIIVIRWGIRQNFSLVRI